MKNPNSPFNRMTRSLTSRWSIEDYPGALPHFHIPHLIKDIATFILLPILSIALYKSIESPKTKPRPNQLRTALKGEKNGSSSSQIIEFRPSKGGGSSPSYFSKKAPGTLVRLKLENVVETYSTAPVHALILDHALGANLIGGTLIGDATPDSNFDRINISFRYARDLTRSGVAASISARALSLNGTLGLEAKKKEGFIARSTILSAHGTSQDLQAKGNSTDLKDILLKALTAGLVQEFGTESQIAKNRADVLSLSPSVEFFAELTDYFPGNSK